MESYPEKNVVFLTIIEAKQMMKEAMGDLFSVPYYDKNRDKIGSKKIVIFEIMNGDRKWNLLKEEDQGINFMKYLVERGLVSKQIVEDIKQLQQAEGEDHADGMASLASKLWTKGNDQVGNWLGDGKSEGYGTFTMLKGSGGRFKERGCCKFGSIFQGWKDRCVTVYGKGVAYRDQLGKVREFMSFSQGFQFKFGLPHTGRQFGIIITANHRKLSLQAKCLKDFVQFLFLIRRASEQSGYMTLNRFNSFAPVRYRCQTKFLVDGQDYFSAVATSLQEAKQSILIGGWMISPEFLLKRKEKQVQLQTLLGSAASCGVKISIILYYQSRFLSNDSLYAKETLQALHENITVLRHPCGKLPVLWSHHGKIIIIDESEAYLGGFDLCYGRYDDLSHSVFDGQGKYPGIEYNNLRQNDRWQVRNYKIPSISRNCCRLPWHDVGQWVGGEVVGDLVHHFYQMWNFVWYQCQRQGGDCYAPSLFQCDTKSIFTNKSIPENSQKIEEGMMQALGKRLKKIQKKGILKFNEIKSKFVQSNIISSKNKQNKQDTQVHSAHKNIDKKKKGSKEYFSSYVEGIRQEIQQKQKGERYDKIRTPNLYIRGKKKRFSAELVRETLDNLKIQPQRGEEKRRSGSFLLSGDRVLDFLKLEIDGDYVACLERMKQRDNKESYLEEVQIESYLEEVQIESLGQHREEQYLWRTRRLLLGSESVQVIRSVGPWSIGCSSTSIEFSIQIAYVQLISQAKHYIYIENQFFISCTADPNKVKNQVGEALLRRIVRAIQSRQHFRVYVILPLLPGFAGDIASEECFLLRQEIQWQYATICRGDSSLIEQIRQYTHEPEKYVQFLSLRNHGKFSPQSQPETEIVYVHSKLMIVDDQMVLCGSANVNDRSLLGDRDSEIAVVTRGQGFVSGTMDGEEVLVSQLAQQLRIKLWKQHFGMDQGECLDPVCEETWSLITNRAKANTLLYREIFGCYPDDLMTNRLKIAEVRSMSQLSRYEELKQQIIGHVVEFPLYFLAGENINLSIAEKEFYVPVECLV